MDGATTTTAMGFLQHLANDVLVWIGFGTVVGLFAKAVMPGRDPGGSIGTVAMGIGGVVIGCGTVSFFSSGTRVTPISPVGFLVATGGAFVILAFYRLLAGKWTGEAPYILPFMSAKRPKKKNAAPAWYQNWYRGAA